MTGIFRQVVTELVEVLNNHPARRCITPEFDENLLKYNNGYRKIHVR
jgi:hypothetical protein